MYAKVQLTRGSKKSGVGPFLCFQHCPKLRQFLGSMGNASTPKKEEDLKESSGSFIAVLFCALTYQPGPVSGAPIAAGPTGH